MGGQIPLRLDLFQKFYTRWNREITNYSKMTIEIEKNNSKGFIFEN